MSVVEDEWTDVPTGSLEGNLGEDLGGLCVLLLLLVNVCEPLAQDSDLLLKADDLAPQGEGRAQRAKRTYLRLDLFEREGGNLSVKVGRQLGRGVRKVLQNLAADDNLLETHHCELA